MSAKPLFHFPSMPQADTTSQSSSAASSDGEDVEPPMKYILVTGGVISGVGKGIFCSSLGVILRSHGFSVSAIKIDPYINIDAGTFSPYEHGEVFVLDDGGEVDLDLGNYERFLDCRLTRDNNITTGKIYDQVIKRERRGDYLGKTVQVVPHITNAISEWVQRVASVPVDGTDRRPHVCIIELGGTIGDIEGRPFVEAFRQFQFSVGREHFMNVHVSMVVETGTDSEQKTKPTQNSVKELRGEGLWPDMVVCRSDKPISSAVQHKVKTFCDFVEVVNVYNVSNIYQVPIILHKQNVLQIVCTRLNLTPPQRMSAIDGSGQQTEKWRRWVSLAHRMDSMQQSVHIALVGKYVELGHEAYTSVYKALKHACVASGRKLVMHWIPSEHLEESYRQTSPGDYHTAWRHLTEAEGIIVPGGFGDRGVEGMISACEWARKHKTPFLGICLGMQCAVIETARNIMGIAGAHSTEFKKTLTAEQQMIMEMPEHCGGDLGGTMRLGLRTSAFLTKDSIVRRLYGQRVDDCGAVEERHRHRYEVNPAHVVALSKAGLRFTGMGVDEGVVQFEEEAGHQSPETAMKQLRVSSSNTSLTPVRNESTNTLLKLALAPAFNKKAGEDELVAKLTNICDDGAMGTASVRMDIVEMKDHPYFVGCQYHPEYLSHPLQPSAPYMGLVLAASGQLNAFLDGSRVPSPLTIMENRETRGVRKTMRSTLLAPAAST